MWDPQLRCKCYRDTLLWKNFFVKITYWVNVWFSLMIKERLSWLLQVPVFFGWQLFTVPDEQDAKLACKQWDNKTPLLPACKKFCSPYITFNLKPVWLLRVFFTHFFPVFKFYSLLDISTDQVFQPDFVRTTKFCKIRITVCNGWGRKSMYSVLRQKWKINSFWKNVTQTNETYNVCFHLICEYFFMFFPTYRISYRILKYLCPISSPTDATSNLFISAFTCSEERKKKDLWPINTFLKTFLSLPSVRRQTFLLWCHHNFFLNFFLPWWKA